MSILTQSNFKGEYHRPGRAYKKRSRFRIKRTPDGFVWITKKGKNMFAPVATKKGACQEFSVNGVASS
jgi:hypothetical protein